MNHLDWLRSEHFLFSKTSWKRLQRKNSSFSRRLLQDLFARRLLQDLFARRLLQDLFARRLLQDLFARRLLQDVFKKMPCNRPWRHLGRQNSLKTSWKRKIPSKYLKKLIREELAGSCPINQILNYCLFDFVS